MKVTVLAMCMTHLISVAIAQNDICSFGVFESPICDKPQNARTISATCNSLLVSWSGGSASTYIVTAYYFDSSINEKRATEPGTNISCNLDGFCTASIPVKGGTLVSWKVQSKCMENNRIFYSYPLRGDKDFPVPICPQIVHNKPSAEKRLNNKIQNVGTHSRQRLIVFPVPVNSTLFVHSLLKSRDQKLKIIDVYGRILIVKNINSSVTQINVDHLNNGTYFITMESRGEIIETGKFIKQ